MPHGKQAINHLRTGAQFINQRSRSNRPVGLQHDEVATHLNQQQNQNQNQAQAQANNDSLFEGAIIHYVSSSE
ncbi:hypothetical protein [Halopseudomonas sp.]|uniref:hypothetical protein n=1 Tax=Halopseudomonas sp. TaxID=2901191 RepID=UPI0039E3BEB3